MEQKTPLFENLIINIQILWLKYDISGFTFANLLNQQVGD